jgi:hypothetical protein
MFLGDQEFLTTSRTPDHPLSLFEGWAASAALCADLLGPLSDGEARFPLVG